MFGTSGIRGIYGKEITEDLARKIASIFVSTSKEQKKLVIGRDIRKSGVSLFEAAAEGAVSCGADVIDLGILPTPTVALATKAFSCPGIMLTASHNPPQYNGLKLIERGKEIGKELEAEITKKYRERGPAGAKGKRGEIFRDHGMVEKHKGIVLDLVDREAVGKKRPKVIVDCNGASSVITPYLLSDLGCRVTSVNASLSCFNRPSEPSAENFSYLGGLVRESGADFAIAHDGDGDRCVILDEWGEALPLDVQLAIMMEHELARSRNRKIVSTVEASLVIRDVVEGAGGSVDVTPVGSTYVGDRLEQSDAIFGGEPCGEYIYRDGVHVPDAALAAAKFAEIFCEKGSFSTLKGGYHQNFMAREKFPAKDKHGAMERIKKRLEGRRTEGKLRTDDGIRIDEEDGWFLIRASGTEPIVRLTIEYKEKGKTERMRAELASLIRKSLTLDSTSERSHQ
jgi:phosphoglucosamine mutase